LRKIRCANIGGRCFSFSWPKKYKSAEGVDLYGEVSYARQHITVATGYSAFETFETLIHETLHALDSRMSERRVTKTAGTLADVLWLAFGPDIQNSFKK
jgi:hypothetical protein